MIEKIPDQNSLNTKKGETFDSVDLVKVREAGDKLDDLARSMGFVSIATIEDLNLTQEQIRQIREFNYRSLLEREPYTKYFSMKREDGEEVKIIARPRADGCYYADFFSLGDHGSNHDFSLSEMKGNMKIHLEQTT